MLAMVAYAVGDAAPWPGSPEMGQHRALISLDEGLGNASAVWVTVPWQRRRVPSTDTTDAVLTVADTGAVVANVVRAPAPNGVSSAEALTFVFEPVATVDDGWLLNNGSAASSIVTSCSGAQRPTLACWKAADGKLLFDDRSPATDEGWDGAVQSGTHTEWIEFDLGAGEPIDRVGVYSVSKSEDPQWYPTHNPANVSVLSRATPSDSWAPLLNTALPPGPFNRLTGWGTKTNRRYFRLEIHSRQGQQGSGSHSYVKEVRFGRGGAAPGPAVPTRYALYYMPFARSGHTTGLSLQDKYRAVNDTAAAGWRQAAGLTAAALADGSFRARLPEGACDSARDARSGFDGFDAME